MNPVQGASSRALVYAAILIGVLVGIEEMIALFHLVPVPKPTINLNDLTEYGKDMIRPERDVPVYLLGCALSAVLGLGLASFWKWRIRKVDKDLRTDREWRTTASLGLIALGSLVVYEPILYLLRSRYKPSGVGLPLAVAVVLPGLLTLVASLIAPRFGIIGRWLASALQWKFRNVPDEDSATVPSRSPGSWILDLAWFLAISLVIIAILYVPSYRELAGRFVEDMTPFHHWDYFVMGPALGYFHGGKLGTEVYTQYGVGYPMIVSWLNPVLPISYGSLMLMSSVYSIVYFMVLAVCLRIALRDRVWATTGVLLALNVQMFRGVFPNETCWGYPSSTILRYPMDVWFFLAILLHLRTGRWIWALMAGIAAGLGLLCITDSGLYLITVLMFYLVVWALHQFQSGHRLVPTLLTTLSALGSMILTIVVGLLAARHGSAFDRGFLPSLFEAMLVYGSSGMSSFPITSKNAVGFGNMLLFSLGCLTALSTLTLLFFRGIPRQARPDLIFGGCVAAYGLEVLIQYVNRSVGMNFYHVIIPFCVLLIGLVAKVLGTVGPGVGRWFTKAVPLVLVVASIAINPLFREYPGLIHRAIHGPEPRRLSLSDNIRGLYEYRSDFVRDVRKVTERMTELDRAGNRLMVLDTSEPMFYLLSGVKPHVRYNPLLINLVSKQQLANAVQRFADDHFDYVIVGKFGYVNIRGQSDFYATLDETKTGFMAIVERDFVLNERIGPYSIWRSRHLEGRSVPAANKDKPPQARNGLIDPVEWNDE